MLNYPMSEKGLSLVRERLEDPKLSSVSRASFEMIEKEILDALGQTAEVNEEIAENTKEIATTLKKQAKQETKRKEKSSASVDSDDDDEEFKISMKKKTQFFLQDVLFRMARMEVWGDKLKARQTDKLKDKFDKKKKESKNELSSSVANVLPDISEVEDNNEIAPTEIVRDGGFGDTSQLEFGQEVILTELEKQTSLLEKLRKERSPKSEEDVLELKRQDDSLLKAQEEQTILLSDIYKKLNGDDGQVGKDNGFSGFGKLLLLGLGIAAIAGVVAFFKSDKFKDFALDAIKKVFDSATKTFANSMGIDPEYVKETVVDQAETQAMKTATKTGAVILGKGIKAVEPIATPIAKTTGKIIAKTGRAAYEVAGLKAAEKKLFPKIAARGGETAAKTVMKWDPVKKRVVEEVVSNKKVEEKVAEKVAGKTIGGAFKKFGTKLVPGVAIGAGGVFTAQRLAEGDTLGAELEAASTAASFIPGYGWIAGPLIDVGILGRDIYKALTEAKTIDAETGEMNKSVQRFNENKFKTSNPSEYKKYVARKKELYKGFINEAQLVRDNDERARLIESAGNRADSQAAKEFGTYLYTPGQEQIVPTETNVETLKPVDMTPLKTEGSTTNSIMNKIDLGYAEKIGKTIGENISFPPPIISQGVGATPSQPQFITPPFTNMIQNSDQSVNRFLSSRYSVA